MGAVALVTCQVPRPGVYSVTLVTCQVPRPGVYSVITGEIHQPGVNSDKFGPTAANIAGGAGRGFALGLFLGAMAAGLVHLTRPKPKQPIDAGSR